MENITINITLDKKVFPELFNLKQDMLDEKCRSIFLYGYNLLYPNINKLQHASIESLNTELIRNDINKLNNSIDINNMNEKIDSFANLMNDFLGITHNSSRKGMVSENIIYDIISNKFKDYTIEITRGKPHNGDAILTIPLSNKKLMIEVKNYSHNVDTDEINKLLYDMKYTNIDHCVFISLKSAFVGKKRLEIKTYNIDNNKYTIVFVPYAFEDMNRIENAIVLMERLYETNDTQNEYKNLYKNINSHLHEIDSIYTTFGEVKCNYTKLECTIKNQLSNHYKILRDYEFNMKRTIDNLWNKINMEFNNYKLERTEIKNSVQDAIKNSTHKSKLKHILELLDFLARYNIYTETNTIEIHNDQCWILMNSVEESIGTLSKQNNTIELCLTKPVFITLSIKKNREDFANSIKVLEGILDKISMN